MTSLQYQESPRFKVSATSSYVPPVPPPPLVRFSRNSSKQRSSNPVISRKCFIIKVSFCKILIQRKLHGSSGPFYRIRWEASHPGIDQTEIIMLRSGEMICKLSIQFLIPFSAACRESCTHGVAFEMRELRAKFQQAGRVLRIGSSKLRHANNCTLSSRSQKNCPGSRIASPGSEQCTQLKVELHT